MDEQTGEPPHPADAARQPASPRRGEALRISPNKNRLVQVRRAGKRKLFDKARKETFLLWLAGTCNVVLSAEKAGVCDKTVYKHLLKDEAFVEAFVRALQVGYLRLEARQMQEAHQPILPGTGRCREAAEGVGNRHDAPSTIDSSVDGPPPRSGEEYEIGILDDDLAEEHFDPELAMQLLREHRRHLPGSREARPAQRTTASAASSEEVAEALAKRLKGFAIRVSKAPPPHPAQAPPESPSPRRGEGNS